MTTIKTTINAFLIPHINLLKSLGYDVDIATNIETDKPVNYRRLCKNIYNIPFNRNPLNKNNFKSYFQIKKIINNNYDYIYVHTPVASAITRYASRNINNTKIIYIAHGFHFYSGAPIKNWLLYYPLEKFLSKYTDVLITINEEDYERALNKFKAKKTIHLNGVGVDIEAINKVKVHKLDKRKELGLKDNDILILSVGELNDNKNHIEIMKAIKDMNVKENIKYIICGMGPNKDKLERFIKENNLTNYIKLLGYRNDIIEIMKVSDIFIFPSKREGLPVSLMEAMACGLPIICSNIRGNIDLVDENQGGFIVKNNNYYEYKKCIIKLIEGEELRNNFGKYNKVKSEKYGLSNILNMIKKIFESKSL